MPPRPSFAPRRDTGELVPRENRRVARELPPGQRPVISREISGSEDSDSDSSGQRDQIEDPPHASTNKGSRKRQLFQGIAEYTANRNGKKSKSSE
jgi:hypothetical protein